MQLHIDQIAIRKDCRARYRIDQATVEEYADANENGAIFPMASAYSSTLTKQTAGRPRTPKHVIEMTKPLVHLANERDGLPIRGGEGGAFEAISTCWQRWGVTATEESVKNWYYRNSDNP